MMKMMSTQNDDPCSDRSSGVDSDLESSFINSNIISLLSILQERQAVSVKILSQMSISLHLFGQEFLSSNALIAERNLN